MNKFIATFLFSILSLSAFAQSAQIMRSGAVMDGDNIILSYPSTTISVDLLVEKREVTPGIYARYAQKYLAMRAPLVAQTTYSVVDASIGLASSDNTLGELTAAAAKSEYVKLPADQYSSIVLSAEDAARDAASMIFTIRRQRRDIINGEAGEGYFGAGLNDAMSRLDAMEQEYLELFMGSTVVTQSVERFLFNPISGANRYVVSRFDSKTGILPATDLTGVPIYLQFTVQGFPDTSAFEVAATDKRAKGVSLPVYRVAAQTQCTLYNDSEQIATTVLPIFELGKDISVEATSIK